MQLPENKRAGAKTARITRAPPEKAAYQRGIDIPCGECYDTFRNYFS